MLKPLTSVVSGSFISIGLALTTGALAHATEAFAQAAAGAAPRPSMLEQFAPFILIFGIFYFLVIRPQQRRSTTHRGFLDKLKRGDSVLTTGGILGTIEGLTEQFVILQIADGVKVRVLKNQIASGINEELVKK
jgi:preprotein translocase subunit YajC